MNYESLTVDSSFVKNTMGVDSDAGHGFNTKPAFVKRSSNFRGPDAQLDGPAPKLVRVPRATPLTKASARALAERR